MTVVERKLDHEHEVEYELSTPVEGVQKDGNTTSGEDRNGREREGGTCAVDYDTVLQRTPTPIGTAKRGAPTDPTNIEHLYRALLLSLLRGSPRTSPQSRPPLPADLLPLITRLAHLYLPSPTPHLTLTSTARLSTPILSMAPCPYKVWFATPPLGRGVQGRVCAVGVRTWGVNGGAGGCGGGNVYGCAMCGWYGGYGGCASRNEHGQGHQYAEVWRMRMGMGINPRDERFGYQVAILERQGGWEERVKAVEGGDGDDENGAGTRWEAVEYNRAFYTHSTNLIKRRTPERGGTPLMWFSHLPVHIPGLQSPIPTQTQSQSQSGRSARAPCIDSHAHADENGEFIEGRVFGPEHEIWEWLEEGDRIALVAGWECEGRRAEMQFRTWFEL